ncbi:sulfatase family protein [Stieleria varia]|uniref:Arylsulfatase n=1 Tax=Stieleria varia TaxID=2528005 RepID=A0A5C6AXV4_9BACT|nr:arylsulfatase [Stieleria varia]TWU02954.1 Arylsulfatase [Stieleria varia]
MIFSTAATKAANLSTTHRLQVHRLQVFRLQVFRLQVFRLQVFRLQVFQVALVLGIASIGWLVPSAEGADRPNIVFILADDQGFGDVSALNPESKIPTPNIDRIASEGMIFGDGHTSSSVCTPTRYSILTGRYHWRTRLQKGVLGGFSPPLISKGRTTVASFLRDQGYHTACIGKWHLGWSWPLKGGGYADDGGDFSGKFKDGWNVDYEADIQNGPNDVGFDYFFGISASLDMPPYVFVRNRRPTQAATVEKAFHRKGPAGADFEAVDVLPTLTAETVGQIKSHAGDDTPFFIYFPLNAPHTPIVPTKEWQGKSKINTYADFTMQVDWTVGQVLDALDEAGVADNTLVIFTTDNGCSPQANIPELEAAGHDQNYIFRGHKADIFDGGHRVPFLARWPGKVKPGTRTEQLVGQLDLLATAAEIVGAALPKNAGEDSVSFLPVLLGEAKEPIRTSIVSQSIGGQFAIRDGNWKLCVCPGSGGWSDPRPGRANLTKLPPMQLYDLANDPGEENNLFAKDPQRVEKMLGMLRENIEKGRSTPGESLANDVEVVMVKPIPGTPKQGK